LSKVHELTSAQFPNTKRYSEITLR